MPVKKIDKLISGKITFNLFPIYQNSILFSFKIQHVIF